MSQSGRGGFGGGGGGGSGSGGGGGGSGSGGGGGGGRLNLGRSSAGVRAVASGVGGFLSDVANRGLTEALNALGLDSLVDKSPTEIALALADLLGGPASTIDQVDLRAALMELLCDLTARATDLATVETAFEQAAIRIEGVLQELFGGYIFERFKTTMSAGLDGKYGAQATDACMQEVRLYIENQVRLEGTGRDLTQVDWNGAEGATLVNEILERTRDIFQD